MLLHIPPALHHRNFRLLWVGLAVSVAGSQMQVWALLWHIRILTDQPIALGGLGLARILPVIVFSLLGGAVADTANRRRILFFTQSVMALVSVFLAYLTLQGLITLWQIYTLTAIQATALAFDLPARQALVPNLVPARDLSNAFSMQSISFQIGSIVGPALSGLVIAYWGQSYTYLIDGLTFLAVILALLLIGPISQRTRGTGRIQIKFVDIAEGVRFIMKQPVILSSMLLDFFATFFSSANTLMPIYARDILNVGAVQYGWLSAAQSIGAMGAAVIISQLKEIKRQGTILLLSVVAFGIATVFFGLSRTYFGAMLALFFIGGSDSVSAIIRNTIRQLQTPDYIRGRMTSINQVFFLGGPQLGEVEAGLVAQLFSAPFAVVSGGIGCLVAVAWIARRWPQLRRYNGDEPIKAGAMAD